MRQWVAYNGRKIPVNPHTGKPAKTTDPETWGTFKDAAEACEKYKLLGIGFVFTEVDPYCGIDLDKCRDADTGKVEPWAADIVAKMASYAEVSPSGTGIHILIKGTVPGKQNRRGQFEVYECGRYFTITGNRMAGTASTIEPRQAELDEVYRNVFDTKKKQSSVAKPAAVMMDDEKILRRIRASKQADKFNRLWAGDITEYADDDSRADLALCRILAFWTGNDETRIDNLFRQSGLMRDKWLRDDYREATLQKAMAGGETYNPKKKRQAADTNDLDAEDGGRQSAADKLLEIALPNLILFQDEYGSGHAVVNVGDHQEVHAVGSKRFKMWLSYIYFQEFEKGISADALKIVQNTLAAQAVFTGQEIRLNLRVASAPDGAFFYDLGGPDWAAVRIDDAGFSVVKIPPVVFRRKANTAAQVVPRARGSLWDFLKFVNVKKEADQRLLLIYLCLCCIPDIPRFVLVAHGEKGSGKSYLLRLIRRVIDPAALELQTLPHDKSEFALTLSSNAFCAFDNIDHLQAWQSDAICMAATGGGVKKRELYTDDDEIILKFKHSVGLCGISNVVTRPDLMDRAILIELSRIDESERRTEAEIEQDFQTVLPGIMADIFTAIAKARWLLDTIRARNLPRMADSARWGAAVAEALGIGGETFFGDLAQNAAVANDESIRANPVALAILNFMADRTRWTGTPANLLVELRSVALEESIDTASRSWPASAESLGKKIRFVKSNLQDAGIEISPDKLPGGRRIIDLQNRNKTAQTAQPAQLPKNQPF